MTRRSAFVMVALAAIILMILFTVASADADDMGTGATVEKVEKSRDDSPTELHTRGEAPTTESFSLEPLHDAMLWHASVHVYDSAVYHQAAAIGEWQRQVEAARQAKIAAAERGREQAREPVSASAPAPVGGGLLARIRSCESGDGRGSYSYTARNPRSSASGAYQFIDSTWRAWRGASTAPRAYLASPAEQEAAARRLFAASGSTPWLASKHCWG